MLTMKQIQERQEGTMIAHFFREEYGKMVAVISRYLGPDQMMQSEDIVQEALVKATEIWSQEGIPEHPKGWLYKTLKHLAINWVKRQKHHLDYQKEAIQNQQTNAPDFDFSEPAIANEQLRMMFGCCHPTIAKATQITLILKILCGFSRKEIASAFLTSVETINKRLVRGRKKLREHPRSFEDLHPQRESIMGVLEALFLLFNEGYFPTHKNKLLRYDLCLEAIRLGQVLIRHPKVKDKSKAYALLALMYFNAARFDSRMNPLNMLLSMEEQDRQKWDQTLINQGIDYLNCAVEGNQVSKYLILATISANHCVAPNFESTIGAKFWHFMNV